MANILEKIKKEKIKMKPRWQFVLKTLLVVLGILVSGLFFLYLISFVFFTLRFSGVLDLPKFGLRGMGPFLFSLPWLLFLFAALLLVVLEILSRRFSFVYRQPILYSVLGIIIFVLLGGVLVAKTGMHPVLFDRAEKGQLPIMGKMYRGYGEMKRDDVHFGMVSELTENGFVMKNKKEILLEIVFSEETRIKPGWQIEEGEWVMVLGKPKDGTVEAFGVRVFDEDMRSSVKFMEGRVNHKMPMKYKILE